MLECKAVVEATGARFSVDIERRIDGGGNRRTQAFDPQEFEKGRPKEFDALNLTVHEFARRLDIATPTLDAVAALVRMRGSVLGLYNFDDRIEKLIFQREDGDS